MLKRITCLLFGHRGDAYGDAMHEANPQWSRESCAMFFRTHNADTPDVQTAMFAIRTCTRCGAQYAVRTM